MKKLLLFITFVTAYVMAFAQNVGIGTINPLARLHVNGNMVISGSGYLGIGTTNPLGMLHVENGSISISNSADERRWRINYSIGNEALQFEEGTLTTTPVSRVRLYSGGYFHINTNAVSSYRLDVGGSGRFTGDISVTDDIFVGSNITVQGGKGLVRSSSGTQLKIVRTSVSFSLNGLGSNATVTTGILNYENFTGVPTVTVGACTVRNGEWFKIIVLPINVTPTECKFILYNTSPDAVSFSDCSWQILVVGPQ